MTVSVGAKSLRQFSNGGDYTVSNCVTNKWYINTLKETKILNYL